MIQLQDDSWTIDEKHIRQEFTAYFQNLYCGPNEVLTVWSEEVLTALNKELPTLNQAHANHIQQQPNSLEITSALIALGANKAPGPDGLNARFIQTYWQELKPNIEPEIRRFFQT